MSRRIRLIGAAAGAACLALVSCPLAFAAVGYLTNLADHTPNTPAGSAATGLYLGVVIVSVAIGMAVVVGAVAVIAACVEALGE